MGVIMAKFNTGLASKIKIRKALLKELEVEKVLDCYAGTGEMYRNCYLKYDYLGLDRRIPVNFTQNLIEIDNTKYLRSENLNQFNVFDLDAFGNPWYQFGIVLHRRTSKSKFVVFCTDSLILGASFGELPKKIKKYINLPLDFVTPCLNRHMDFIRKLFINKMCVETNHTVLRCLASTNHCKRMKYIGIVLQRN